MSKQPTKAELLARIDAAERATIEAIQREDALRAELATATEFIAALREQYAAKRAERATIDAPIVHMGGRACYKVRRLEHGRMVTTYRPVEMH
jgi:hypothetical protein